MTREIAEVEAVAWSDLEALDDGDAVRLSSLFLPESALFARGPDGAVAVLPRDLWLDRVRGRQSARAAGHANTNEIYAVEVLGSMASVRLTCSHPPNRFDDTLTLIQSDAGWKIVSKTDLATLI